MEKVTVHLPLKSRKRLQGLNFQRGRNKLSLEKKGKEWLVNGKDDARKSSILFIIRVLKEIQIKSPVSPEKFNSEITEKGINPVKVKIYEKSRLLKSFLVYKTGSNIYGNIMKIRGEVKAVYCLYSGL